MNDHIQKRENLPQNWDFQKLIECFQVSSINPTSFLECVWVYPKLYNVLKASGLVQRNRVAVNWFLVMESRMARYQFQVYDLDEFYMIFVRYWKWKFDGCTSGFSFSKFWLTLCMCGVWEWFLSLGCFGDVWVVQTTFIWYLESVRSITLVRNCKDWDFAILPLWNL